MPNRTTTKKGAALAVVGDPRRNTAGLPYGSGSVQVRGANYWMMYRDAKGKLVQENAWTLDEREAVRLLACRSIDTLEARLQVLREVAYEGANQARETKAPGQGNGDAAPGNRAGQGRIDAGAVGRSGAVRVVGAPQRKGKA